MNNHICINGKIVELTADQVAQIVKAAKLGTKLSEIPVGNTFKIDEHEFIVLEQSGDTTAAILKNLLPVNKFDNNSNNFCGSDIEVVCDEFANEIAATIGKENIVEHEVNLTSNDGLKDYGTIECNCSLLTADQYRKYVEILDKYNPGKRWWLSTPWSTPTHNCHCAVCCVYNDGGSLSYDGCGSDYGVRPFLIFRSSIFVSF